MKYKVGPYCVLFIVYSSTWHTTHTYMFCDLCALYAELLDGLGDDLTCRGIAEYVSSLHIVLGKIANRPTSLPYCRMIQMNEGR
jgi:hypothetical protein